MTVCIAAICQWEGREMIVGASDRMLTAGDIEFDAGQTKLYLFAPPRTVAMAAGDHSECTQVCMDSYRDTIGMDGVAAIAGVIAENYRHRRHEIAEHKILAPLGLTVQSFTDKQKGMTPELAVKLACDLQNADLGVQFIIAGTDAMGAHIYVVGDPGESVCRNGVAYAAIGTGARLAESSFMFDSYTRRWPADAALFLCYRAKKHAESAPNVGQSTDLFYIRPDGHYGQASDEFIISLNERFGPMAIDVLRFGRQKLQDVAAHVRRFLTGEEGESQPAQPPPEGTASRPTDATPPPA